MRKWILVLLIGLVSGVALAQPTVLSGDHQNHVLAGEGKDFVIEGHHLNVAVTGRCGKIVVSGHHNDVVLEEPTVIDASGHHNNIVYQRGNPEVLKSGSYNTIVHSSGTGQPTQTISETPTSSTGTTITGSGVRRTEEGNGRLFSISGSGNEITIKGTATVIVSGSGNVVEVENPSAITVSGVGNVVYYKSGYPVIMKGGVDNRVEKR